MSEDRLQKALEAMTNENVDPGQLAGARDRVWERLGNPSVTACAEFQPALGDYLGDRLPAGRRLLVDDHISRCPQCRARLAELRGVRKVVPIPQRRASRWPQWRNWAAAAALVAMSVYLGRDRIDTMLAPAGPRATVASVSGTLYRMPEGMLQAGAALGQDDMVRTGPGSRAVLRLADGSLVDVNERSELYVSAAWTGQTVHLQRGDIIVQAARQHHGRLRVQTRDSIASVKGTVFAVSAGIGGTLVSVVEGSVAVRQPGVDVVLKSGQQSASNPALAETVQDAVSWSPDAEKYLSILESVSEIEKKLAGLPSPALRTQPRLLQSLPAQTVVYGAIPNLGGTIAQTMALAEQQAAENATFKEWWNSDSGLELKRAVDLVQTVTPLLGNEIVFTLSTPAPGIEKQIPAVFAEVLPGKQVELSGALDALRAQATNASIPYAVDGMTLVISDSREHLQWVLGHLGQGTGTPFETAIAERYQRGVDWLVGMDIAPMLATMPDAAGAGWSGAQQMKHLILEQRDTNGTEENEVTLSFQGPRMGMASWLASTGSGGAAEYLASEAMFAAYASTREPRQLFEELTAQLTRDGATPGGAFGEAEAKLGPGFAASLVAALGTESAFSLNGFTTTGPVWTLALLVNDPATVESSLQKVVDVCNSELSAADSAKRITLTRELADGRTWTTMRSTQFPLSVTWTYDRGYLVAASDRGAATRAIGARDGGSALVWSSDFRQQWPSSSGMHPSAFAWLNTKGALEGFAALVPNPTVQKLIGGRDPILVVFDGTTEQIHSASRTRITGLAVDIMLLENLRHVPGGAQSPALRQ